MTTPFSEDEIIARLFAPIAGPGGLGLKDDAALISPPPGRDIVATTDSIVAGVHFFADDPPESVARKALRVNLSDLAAKGAEPLGFLLTLALPSDLPADWLTRFAGSLGEDCRRFKIDLLGGDTVKTPGPPMISISALGSAPAGRMVSRAGARAGDILFVSGSIGDAAIGLRTRMDVSLAARLSPPARAALARRYLEPSPRGALALAMRECARAGMDVSDGFVGDLAKMLRASDASGKIDLRRAPLSDAAREAISIDPTLFDLAVTGGDDYELLASVSPDRATRFEDMAREAGVSVTRVGEVVGGLESPEFLGLDGQPAAFARASYSHF